MVRQFSVIALCVISGLMVACGYQFQGKRNPLKELGIEKIYVQGFTNATYRPGIEQLFSTSMIREIQKARSFRIVSNPKEADAILSGTVTVADSNVSSTTQAVIEKTVNVAAEYNVFVSCAIQLKDRHGRIVFSQTVSDSKIYPGVVRTGDPGATGPLVNESEQRLAIQFLATQMMASAYQRMIDTF